MEKGYIDTCPELGYKAYVYDWDKLQEIKSKFSFPKFWDKYNFLKQNDPNNTIVKEVRYYAQRKSSCERQSINYPIQTRGSIILKIAMVNFFNWIVDNGYFNKVKLCTLVHDEVCTEAPEEIAEEVNDKLHEVMVKAGKFICKIVPLDTDTARLSDGSLPTYWIH